MAEVVLDLTPVQFPAVTVRELPLAPSDLGPFRRELTGYCYRMLGSGFEAEDAVQEVMLRAWRSAPRFEGAVADLGSQALPSRWSSRLPASPPTRRRAEIPQ
jgi:RNA polymerase sigma-70 factor (ECF subfamily)